MSSLSTIAARLRHHLQDDKKLPIGAGGRYLTLLSLLETTAIAKPFRIVPSSLSPEERAFAGRLAHHVLVSWYPLTELANQCLIKKLRPQDKVFSLLVLMVVAEMVILKTAAHAVSTIMRPLAMAVGERARVGVLQAIIKKIEREQMPLPFLPLSPLLEYHQTIYGATAVVEMARIYAEPAPLDIMCANKTIAKKLLNDKNLAIYQPTVLPFDDMVRFHRHPSLNTISAFNDGAVWVQDVAATIPARLLMFGQPKNLVVADLCAAPGGKTRQLAQMGARVVAVEQSGVRAQMLADNIRPFDTEKRITITMGDITTMAAQPCHFVLLDAPCSATGTLRKNPDIAVIKTQQDILKNAMQQKKFLPAAWRWLKTGGRLVYAVCSLEREEGESLVAHFLNQEKTARLIPINRQGFPWLDFLPEEAFAHGFLRTLPYYMASGMDGFFMALLEKI